LWKTIPLAGITQASRHFYNADCVRSSDKGRQML
jgi:hypothetical protein